MSLFYFWEACCFCRNVKSFDNLYLVVSTCSLCPLIRKIANDKNEKYRPIESELNIQMDDEFALCWNNFQDNLSTGFQNLFDRGDLVDVTLACDGKLLQAHKIVLAICSPYFQEMFITNPCKHPISEYLLCQFLRLRLVGFGDFLMLLFMCLMNIWMDHNHFHWSMSHDFLRRFV